MSVRVTVRGEADVVFPRVCVVCEAPAEHDYTVSRSLTVGDATYSLSVPVPLCASHLEAATRISPAERFLERLGAVLGSVAGLAAIGGLLVYWSVTGQAVNIGTGIVAAFVGAGIGLALWALLGFVAGPLFGDTDSKRVRSAVRIRHYWPAQGDIQLEFAEPAVADLVAKANGDRVISRG